MVKNLKEKTNFGFQIVDKSKKTKMVNHIFHSVATNYDLMNDFMSFGIHRLWKQVAVNHTEVKEGQIVLDLASGTGDIATKLSNLVGEFGLVVLLDINDSMLKVGREKLRNIGILGNIEYVQGDAEKLPFFDNTFDCIIVSFGLRNFTDKEKALHSIFRVLKPGGRLLILEFSKPIYTFLSKLYNIYSLYVLPLIGKIVINDAYSYRYLAESIYLHPNQDVIKEMIKNAGFKNVSYFNMSAGIVALHRGYKF